MTPQELEDETIRKIGEIEDKHLAAVDKRDDILVRANEEFRMTTYRLGLDRLRVLMQHTVEAINLKDNS